MPANTTTTIITDYLRQDPIMDQIIQLTGETEVTSSTNPDLLPVLVDTIISQQLSVKAANTIYQRFLTRLPDQKLTVEGILTLTEQQIRETGVSTAKAGYIRNLALQIKNQTLDLEQLPELTDEQVRNTLVALKGFGNWSAEMVMISSLNRPDIFSVDDAGIQAAMSYWYKIDRKQKQHMIQLAQTWKPYRTYACRYLWKSIPFIKNHANPTR